MAQTVYLKILRIAMRSPSHISRHRLFDLNQYVPQLRQMLSCVVCCNLLVDPYSPKDRRCTHYVCRLCVRGRKRLMPICPKCKDCSDFRTYEENRIIALLLLCYKSLCMQLMQSSLYAQLAGLRPDVTDTRSRGHHDGNSEIKSLIKLPPKTTQEFISEGVMYDDTSYTFLPQPDSSAFLNDLPTSLPAETPPTTAATTPELPFEQHMPESLSISAIELEAATTAEQAAQFAHPLPIMPTGSRMMAHSVAHSKQQQQPQVLMASGSTQTVTHLEPAYVEHVWTDHVDLSGALSSFPVTALASSTPNMVSTGAQTYLWSSPSHPTVVQVMQPVTTVAAQPPPPAPVPTVTTTSTISGTRVLDKGMGVGMRLVVGTSSGSQKRKHADLEDNTADAAAATRMCLRNKKLEMQEVATVRPSVATTAAAAAAAAAPLKVAKEMPPPPPPSAFQKVSPRTHPCCRCGTTTQPSNTTCRTGRCPCYKLQLACFECKCIGCQNPFKKININDKSDEEEDEEEEDLDEEEQKEEEEKAEAKEQEGEAAVPKVAMPPPSPPEQEQDLWNSDITFAAVSNYQQSQHPLVFMLNDDGEYQGFNLFIGETPISSTRLQRNGCQRVPLQLVSPTIESETTSEQFAYFLPGHMPALAAETTEDKDDNDDESNEQLQQQPPAKKLKTNGGGQVQLVKSTGAISGRPKLLKKSAEVGKRRRLDLEEDL